MKINELNRKISRACRNFPLCRNSKIVSGEGDPHAKIMLVGQNPGKEENIQGRPFVGRSGKFLDMVLEKNNLRRKKLYITSVVKCKTPENRKPANTEIRFFMPFLTEQIKSIKPKIVVLMGEVAWKTPRIKGIRYIKTYHPAAAMRFPKIRKKFEKDFSSLSLS